MLKKKDIWKRIITSLEADLDPSEFHTWFSQSHLKSVDPSLAVVEVPNKFVASWLQEHHEKNIRVAFQKNFNFKPKIHFSFKKPEPPNSYAETNGYAAQERWPFSHRLDPAFSFDNFVTGPWNELAYSSAIDVATSPAENYNPLYIFSDQSAGKTHLLNAIGNHMIEINPNVRVRYHTKKHLTTDFSTAKRNRTLQAFREEYTQLDCLIIDDLHLFSAKIGLQQELVSLLNYFCDSRKQVVFAAKEPPVRIKNILPELRSRLEWGLISEIKQPDQEAKMLIIKEKAAEKDLYIPEDVTFFLANTTNDLKRIYQFIVSIETYTSLYNRKIDISTAKSIIKSRYIPNIAIPDIQKATAAYFNITLTDLISNKKKRSVTYPRQIAMYVTRKLTGLSYEEIGKAFGNKDHSTVIYAVKRIKKQKELKNAVLLDIEKVESLLS